MASIPESRDADIISSWVRPVILTGAALLFLASSFKAFPSKWGLEVSDLGLQQVAVLLLLFAGLINASLYLVQRTNGGSILSGGLGGLVDLTLIGCLLMAAAGQRSWFVPLLLVVVAASGGTGRRWMVVISTLVASGLFLTIPSLQTALGRTAEFRSMAEQVTIVGMILAAARSRWVLQAFQKRKRISPCPDVGVVR